MEKYSVLMSLYIKENPDFFRAAAESMLNQTAAPDEIVVVKDGPITEELQKVLTELENRCPDIMHVVGYEENKGLGYALNYGIQKCRNELIARMDTDDIAHPDRCMQQLKYFAAHPETDILGGDISEFIGEPENIVGYRRVPSTNSDIRDYIRTRCPFNHMTVMYRRQAVLDAGNYLDWFWNEDYYLWLRMALKQAHMANTGTVLVNVRTGEDMYRRRGGKKYFRSEAGLQKYMLDQKIINVPTYCMNMAKRIIVQVLLPNRLRGWVFKKFARSGS